MDISNKDIKTHVLKSKEKEKSKITKRLGDMSTEEREVENLLKNHRIGRWNLGQTRALFEYDGEQYEKERLEAEQTARAEEDARLRELYPLPEDDEEYEDESYEEGNLSESSQMANVNADETLSTEEKTR